MTPARYSGHLSHCYLDLLFILYLTVHPVFLNNFLYCFRHFFGTLITSFFGVPRNAFAATLVRL